MNKMKNILGFMIVALSVFMTGFTTIKAQEAPKSISVTWNSAWYNDGAWRSYVKFAKDDNGNAQYAFCLDSEKDVYTAPISINTSLYPGKVAAVNNIMTNAVAYGLGSTNKWGISNDDLYGVAQIAIWKAVHGTNQPDGYIKKYQNWITSKGYQDILAALEATGVSETASIDLAGTQGMKVQDKYLVSNEYAIKTSGVPSSAKITVSVKGGEINVNGGAWTDGTVIVKSGDVIKVRVLKPTTGSGNVSATVDVKTSEFLFGSDTYFYGAPNGFQNIALTIPSTTSVAKSLVISGSYTNKVDLNVSKTDATGQKELAGADMVVYDLDGKKIDSWTSEEGKTHLIKGLDADKIYMIEETAAPEGYDKLKTEIYFQMDESGKVTTCKTDVVKANKTCEAMSTDEILNIKNYPTKTVDLNVSKTDATGQKELAGADMVVYDLDGKKIDSWTSEEGKTHLIKDLKPNKIYMIEETAAPEGYDKLKTEIYFQMDESGKVTTCKTDVVKANKTCEAMSTDEILNIKNYPTKVTEVKITKKDISNGKEIEGAHLQILDENGKVVDEWTSTKEEHVIKGLAVGKYTLIETLPASNYKAEMIIEGNRTSKYQFEVKEDGVTKIDVYNEIKTIDVPNTGVSASIVYIIGGLVMTAGVGTVAFARRKEEI